MSKQKKLIKNLINVDNVTREDPITRNLNWASIPDHPYIILITGSSGSGKTNVLLNLIYYREDDDIINKIYLYAYGM